METVQEGNRLIAEFMGLESMSWKSSLDESNMLIWIDKATKMTVFDEPELQYHTSWDWLKPVIDKIFTYSLAYDEAKAIRDMSIVVDILPCWEKVIKIIQFLNSQTPTP